VLSDIDECNGEDRTGALLNFTIKLFLDYCYSFGVLNFAAWERLWADIKDMTDAEAVSHMWINLGVELSNDVRRLDQITIVLKSFYCPRTTAQWNEIVESFRRPRDNATVIVSSSSVLTPAAVAL